MDDKFVQIDSILDSHYLGNYKEQFRRKYQNNYLKYTHLYYNIPIFALITSLWLHFLVNSIDDELIQTLHTSGILTASLSEIIPSLGHRLQIQAALNAMAVSNQSIEVELVGCPGITQPPNERTASSVHSQVKCTICFLCINKDWKSIWGHLKYKHLLIQSNINWQCPICKSQLMRFNDFKRHV